MQNNFTGPPIPPDHYFVGPPYPEKNIIVNYGQPRTESSTGPSDGGNIHIGNLANPSRHRMPGDPPGRYGSFRDSGMPAVVRNRLAHAHAAANAAANANAAAAAANTAAAAQAAAIAQQRALIAQQIAQQQAAAAAAAAAHQLAQQQAAETARQFAIQQAAEAARVAQQQAASAAQQQAEAALRQLTQEQAEAAARYLIQQQAENARIAAEADAKAHAQATMQAVIAAPSFTPASRSASLAFEMAIRTATLQFLSSATRVLGPVSLALYPSELGDGDLRPASSSNPTAPPGIDALGPTTLPAASAFPFSYPGGNVVSSPTQNETLPGVDPADANASIPGRPADEELPAPNEVFNLPPRDHDYHVKPEFLPAFPDAKWAKSKTPAQRGNTLRPRWKDKDGTIYEWDSQHGAVEKYNKRGRHLGEYNHETGAQTKPANQSRKVEP